MQREGGREGGKEGEGGEEAKKRVNMQIPGTQRALARGGGDISPPASESINQSIDPPIDGQID